MREFLTERGVPFVERNIRNEAEAKQELLARTGNMVVPVLFVGDQKIVGWDQDAIVAALQS